MNPLRPEGHTPCESPGIVKARDSLSVVYCRLVIVWGRRGRCASGTGLALAHPWHKSYNCSMASLADAVFNRWTGVQKSGERFLNCASRLLRWSEGRGKSVGLLRSE